MTITEFILARVAEDEAAARVATEGPWIAYDVGRETDYGAGWWWVWREKALPYWGGVMEPEDSHLPDCVPNSVVGSCGISDGRNEAQDEADAKHIARWDPARVLAECKATRAIVERHVPDRQLENWYWLERKCSECGKTWHKWLPNRRPTDIGPEQGCPTLRALAAIYAAHPDYDESWTL